MRRLRTRLIRRVYPELAIYTRPDAPAWLAHNLGAGPARLARAFANVLEGWGINSVEELGGATIADLMMGHLGRKGGRVHQVRVV